MGMDVSAGPKKKGRHAPEMNVTPLVDVVLVLLIIFMVITPAMFKQLWVHIPKKPENDAIAAAANPNQPLVVSVAENGRIHINRDELTDGEVADRLPRILAARPDRKVFFDADEDVPFERAAFVIDLAKSKGAIVAVMTNPIET